MADPQDYPRIDLQPVVPEDALERHADEISRALLIRRTEERLLQLFSEGKLYGTLHTCIGQEFVGLALARALEPGDALVSNHRGHGHFLARTGNLVGLIGEVMGRSIGVCGGRGGSQHLHQDTFYSNGVLGGTVPIATGLAFARKLRGAGGIAAVCVGDGALGEGVLYESMNIASRLELPLLIVCENNLFAQSTCQTQTLAGDIGQRAAAFGIETAHGDTWNWPGLLESLRQSAERVRRSGRPLFHRVDTFRLMGHSKGDDNRPESYVEHHRRRDPLNAIEVRFADDPRWKRMNDEAGRAVTEAVAQAEASPFATLERPAEAPPARPIAGSPAPAPRERVAQSVRRGLEEALRERPEVLLIGEDLESPYGGAFKCTQGLSEEFPGRVRNMPVSEAAIMGLGSGLALAGFRPVVEIMFGDFLALAADQWINHAAKFRFMYGGKVSVPLIVRTPMGGKRGYGPTHSQSLEKHFLGVPDTQVLGLHHRVSPAALYRRLFDTIDRPTLVLENKVLYGATVATEAPAGFHVSAEGDALFPTVRVRPELPADLTLVAIGGMGPEAEQAALTLFREDEIAADLFLPTRLYPFDLAPVMASLAATGRLLVVEEGQGFVSLGSEIVAQVVERSHPGGVACRRVAAAPAAIPAARPLEEQCLPGVAEIVARARELVREHVH